MKGNTRQSWILISLFLLHSSISASAEQWKPGDPCPTEIRSGIGNSWHGDKFGHMVIIHAVMLICPNVKILELYSTGGSTCAPTTEGVMWPFNKAAPLIERWASAPEVLILDDFLSNADPFPGPGSIWMHDTTWYPDWYREYISNLTSSKHDSSEGQQQEDEQKQPEESTGINDNKDNMGSMSTIQGLMEMGSNSSVIGNGRKDTHDSRSPEKETNFDVWLKVMDFSRIHTLKLGQRAQWGGTYTLTHRLAETLPPHLVSLKDLEVKNAIGGKFIVNLPKNVSLTHLTWREPWAEPDYDPGIFTGFLLGDILQRHGSTLETLHFHSHDTGQYGGRPGLGSYHGLGTILKQIPNIKKLTLGLRRPFIHDWPWKDLKKLATELPNLTDLTIYFDLAYLPCQTPPYTRQLLATPGTPGVLPSYNTNIPPNYQPPPTPPSASPLLAISPAPSPCHPTDEKWNKDCMGRDAYAQPMVSKSEGEKIARFLAQQRATVNGGKPFQRIRIRSGNGGWGTEGGYMSGSIVGKSAWDWIDWKSSWVSCFGKDWVGLPDEERNKVVEGKEEEFVCFAGENLEELKEWEERCQQRVKRHTASTTEAAWRTGDGHGHHEDGVAERSRKWLVDSEREE